ncbi:MAG: sulfotransferase [Magnetococcales bacterium]|nr:sulfotransferase [Magnetococcales bacterium]
MTPDAPALSGLLGASHTTARPDGGIVPLPPPPAAVPSGSWSARAVWSGTTPVLGRLEVWRVVLGLGQAPRFPREEPREQAVVLLHGVARATLAEADRPAVEHRLTAGDLLLVPPGVRCTLHNDHDDGASFLLLAWRAPAEARRAPLPSRRCSPADEGGETRDHGGYRARLAWEGSSRFLAKFHAHYSEMDAGAGYAPHADDHDVALILLEGQVESLGESATAPAFLFYPAHRPHGLANPGPRPARYLALEFHGAASSSVGENPALSQILSPDYTPDSPWRRWMRRWASWREAGRGRSRGPIPDGGDGGGAAADSGGPMPRPLDLLEMHAWHGCNLGCESCSHFAPHQGDPRVDLAACRTWMETWAKKVRPARFKLVGGEPLLNPDAPALIRAAAATWEGGRVVVGSNGLRLPRHPQLLEALLETGGELILSAHHDGAAFREAMAPALALAEAWRRRGLSVEVISAHRRWTRRYHRFEGRPIFFHSDPRRAWEVCIAKAAPQLWQNQIWKCGPLASAARMVQEWEGDAWPKGVIAAYRPLEPSADAEAMRRFFAREEEPVCALCPERLVPFALPDPRRVGASDASGSSVEVDEPSPRESFPRDAPRTAPPLRDPYDAIPFAPLEADAVPLDWPLTRDAALPFGRRALWRGSSGLFPEWKAHLSQLGPGASPHPPHAHDAAEELMLVLEGRGEFLLPSGAGEEDPRRLVLDAGSLLFLPARARHTLRNPGTAPLLYLTVKWTGAGEGRPGSPLSGRLGGWDDLPAGSRRTLLTTPTAALAELRAEAWHLAPGDALPSPPPGEERLAVLFAGRATVEGLGTLDAFGGMLQAGGRHRPIRAGSDGPARGVLMSFRGPPGTSPSLTGEVAAAPDSPPSRPLRENVLNSPPFPPSEPLDDRSIVFLLGAPRSGTTLLSVLLAGHPALLVPPESWLMLAGAARGALDPDLPADGRLINQAVGTFVDDESHAAGVRAYVRAVIGAKLAAAGKSLFVEKTPRNYLALEFIEKVFPNARYLWLRRNPLDVAASLREANHWDPVAALQPGGENRDGMDWILGHHRLLAFWRRHPERIHPLRYEDLTARPEAELAAIFRFLDLPGPLPPVAFGETLAPFAASRFGDRKVLRSTRPHPLSVHRWRDEFAPETLQILLDALGGATFSALGYETALAEAAERGVVPGSPRRGEEALARYEGFVAAAAGSVEAKVPEWTPSVARAADPEGWREERTRLLLALERMKRESLERDADQARAFALAHVRRERESFALRQELSAVSQALQHDAEQLLASRSWTLARPLRQWANRLRGRQPERPTPHTVYWRHALMHIRNVHASISWELTAPLRLIAKLARRLRRGPPA